MNFDFRGNRQEERAQILNMYKLRFLQIDKFNFQKLGPSGMQNNETFYH